MRLEANDAAPVLLFSLATTGFEGQVKEDLLSGPGHVCMVAMVTSPPLVSIKP